VPSAGTRYCTWLSRPLKSSLNATSVPWASYSAITVSRSPVGVAVLTVITCPAAPLTW